MFPPCVPVLFLSSLPFFFPLSFPCSFPPPSFFFFSCLFFFVDGLSRPQWLGPFHFGCVRFYAALVERRSPIGRNAPFRLCRRVKTPTSDFSRRKQRLAHAPPRCYVASRSVLSKSEKQFYYRQRDSAQSEVLRYRKTMEEHNASLRRPDFFPDGFSGPIRALLTAFLTGHF